MFVMSVLGIAQMAEIGKPVKIYPSTTCESLSHDLPQTTHHPKNVLHNIEDKLTNLRSNS